MVLRHKSCKINPYKKRLKYLKDNRNFPLPPCNTEQRRAFIQKKNLSVYETNIIVL